MSFKEKMNYHRDDRQLSEWPERKVIRYVQVNNEYDGELFAVRKDLECGHWLVATGSFVFDSGMIRCKKCYEMRRVQE